MYAIGGRRKKEKHLNARGAENVDKWKNGVSAIDGTPGAGPAYKKRCSEKQKIRRMEKCENFRQHDLIGEKIGDTVLTEENVCNRDIAKKLLNRPIDKLNGQSIMDVAKKGQSTYIGISYAEGQNAVEAEYVGFLTRKGKGNKAVLQKDMSRVNGIDQQQPNNIPRVIPYEQIKTEQR